MLVLVVIELRIVNVARSSRQIRFRVFQGFVIRRRNVPRRMIVIVVVVVIGKMLQIRHWLGLEENWCHARQRLHFSTNT